MHVLNPLIEINRFFKDLGSMTLKEDSLRKLEENIPPIICKLERIFPLEDSDDDDDEDNYEVMNDDNDDD